MRLWLWTALSVTLAACGQDPCREAPETCRLRAAVPPLPGDPDAFRPAPIHTGTVSLGTTGTPPERYSDGMLVARRFDFASTFEIDAHFEATAPPPFAVTSVATGGEAPTACSVWSVTAARAAVEVDSLEATSGSYRRPIAAVGGGRYFASGGLDPALSGGLDAGLALEWTHAGPEFPSATLPMPPSPPDLLVDAPLPAAIRAGQAADLYFRPRPEAAAANAMAFFHVFALDRGVELDCVSWDTGHLRVPPEMIDAFFAARPSAPWAIEFGYRTQPVDLNQRSSDGTRALVRGYGERGRRF
ncbi:MAG: hypothetical protein U1E65_28400 [Myxococcota bacterium]